MLGEASEGGVLLQPDDAFAQVMGVEKGGHVQGVGFGPTPSGTHTRNMEDCMPPLTSTATNQLVKELTAEVVELREKCSYVEFLKAKMALMRNMFSQLDPLFLSQVKSLNFICHVFFITWTCSNIYSVSREYGDIGELHKIKKLHHRY